MKLLPFLLFFPFISITTLFGAEAASPFPTLAAQEIITIHLAWLGDVSNIDANEKEHMQAVLQGQLQHLQDLQASRTEEEHWQFKVLYWVTDVAGAKKQIAGALTRIQNHNLDVKTRSLQDIRSRSNTIQLLTVHSLMHSAKDITIPYILRDHAQLGINIFLDLDTTFRSKKALEEICQRTVRYGFLAPDCTLNVLTVFGCEDQNNSIWEKMIHIGEYTTARFAEQISDLTKRLPDSQYPIQFVITGLLVMFSWHLEVQETGNLAPSYSFSEMLGKPTHFFTQVERPEAAPLHTLVASPLPREGRHLLPGVIPFFKSMKTCLEDLQAMGLPRAFVGNAPGDYNLNEADKERVHKFFKTLPLRTQRELRTLASNEMSTHGLDLEAAKFKYLHTYLCEMLHKQQIFRHLNKGVDMLYIAGSFVSGSYLLLCNYAALSLPTTDHNAYDNPRYWMRFAPSILGTYFLYRGAERASRMWTQRQFTAEAAETHALLKNSRNDRTEP